MGLGTNAVCFAFSVNIQDSSCQSIHCSQEGVSQRPQTPSFLRACTQLFPALSALFLLSYKDRLLVLNLSLTANSYESPCLHPLLRWDSSLLSLPHPLYFLCQVFISCCQFVLISSHQRVGWGPLSLIIWSADLLVPFETEQGTHNFTSEKQLCPWPLLLMRQDPNPNSRPQICCIPEKAVCSLP